MSIVTPADLQLNMIEDMDDDDPFDFDPELAQQLIEGMEMVQATLPSALKSSRKASSINSDSVSTFRSHKKHVSLSRQNRRRPKGSQLHDAQHQETMEVFNPVFRRIPHYLVYLKWKLK